MIHARAHIALLLTTPLLGLLLGTGCKALPLADVEGDAAPCVVEVTPLTTRPTPGAFLPDPDILFGDDLAVLVIQKTELRAYPWPESVTKAERRLIEEAITAAVEVGGRDGRDGEDYLVALDRGRPAKDLKASGRLVSEFNRLLEEEDAADRLTRAKLRLVDAILRRIDGVQERRIFDFDGIRTQTPEDRIREVALVWNWWYQHERFHRRYPPWDERFDGTDR